MGFLARRYRAVRSTRL